jgi:hypothetical protein
LYQRLAYRPIDWLCTKLEKNHRLTESQSMEEETKPT